MSTQPMKPRDLEYIENRLIGPAPGVTEAIDRMRSYGYGAEAAELMVALQAFTEACRRARTLVVLGEQATHDRLRALGSPGGRQG